MKKTSEGAKVARLSVEAIRTVATMVRSILFAKNPELFRGLGLNTVKLFEYAVLKSGSTMAILTKEEMGDNHGLTTPDDGVIRIREDVYRGARDGDPDHKWTLFHELGHLILHPGQAPQFARSSAHVTHDKDEDSEWQADQFTAEFLMPAELVKRFCRTPKGIKEKFNVPWQEAQERWRDLKAEGLI